MKSILALLSIFPRPAPVAALEPPPPAVEHRPDPGFERLKLVAAHIAAGTPTRQMLEDMSPDNLRWLSTLDKMALARVACAEQRALSMHLLGVRYIHGVRPADRATVDAYVEAIRRPRLVVVGDGDGRGGSGGPRRSQGQSGMMGRR